MDIDSATTAITIITPFILLGVGYWITRQSKVKEERQKRDEERKALELKIMTERVAKEVKTEVELTKLKTEDMAIDLKTSSAVTAERLKTHTDQTNKEIISKIEAIDRKVMEMLYDLRKRADLTNGNVSTIRSEIAELYEDIESLYQEEAERSPDSPSASRKRLLERKKRDRRRRIEQDRVAQSERSLNPSRAGDRW